MKISIITVNYNNADGLQRTLTSIEEQTYNGFELVMVDGGSQDGSKELIERFAKGKAKISWVSEPDRGIYNAMNKGVKMSSGDYCIFMNSGDCFFDDYALENCLQYLDGSCDIVSGGMKSKKFSKEAPPESALSMAFFVKDSMSHQSTFIKRLLLMETPYNEQRKVAGDHEFFFRKLIIEGVSYLSIPVVVSYCEDAGASGNLELSFSERYDAIKKHLPSRMTYDVDFMIKYHNPVVMKIGSMVYRPFVRRMYKFIHGISRPTKVKY